MARRNCRCPGTAPPPPGPPTPGYPSPGYGYGKGTSYGKHGKHTGWSCPKSGKHGKHSYGKHSYGAPGEPHGKHPPGKGKYGPPGVPYGKHPSETLGKGTDGYEGKRTSAYDGTNSMDHESNIFGQEGNDAGQGTGGHRLRMRRRDI